MLSKLKNGLAGLGLGMALSTEPGCASIEKRMDNSAKLLAEGTGMVCQARGDVITCLDSDFVMECEVLDRKGTAALCEIDLGRHRIELTRKLINGGLDCDGSPLRILIKEGVESRVISC